MCRVCHTQEKEEGRRQRLEGAAPEVGHTPSSERRSPSLCLHHLARATTHNQHACLLQQNRTHAPGGLTGATVAVQPPQEVQLPPSGKSRGLWERYWGGEPF